MDPVTMMMALSGGLKVIGGAFEIFGQASQYKSAKRAINLQQAELMKNNDGIMQRSTFEQNRITDVVEDIQAKQLNAAAGGNLDPTSGSPAFAMAQAEMESETDRLLTGARGMQERADNFGQIASLQSQLSDKRTALSWGVGSTLLKTAQSLVDLGGQAAKSGGFGTASAASSAVSGKTGFGFAKPWERA
jgi:hypothetical protein